jgi:FtsP/CotA-like multicopper oxidase with cupredoxin domain
MYVELFGSCVFIPSLHCATEPGSIPSGISERTSLSLFKSSIFPIVVLFATAASAFSQSCPHPAEGSLVAEPPSIESSHGTLETWITFRDFTASDGQQRFCYFANNGAEAPTLRLKPGDRLILHLKNQLAAPTRFLAPQPAMPSDHSHPGARACANGGMTPLSTNLHFHGLTVPPICHEDDTLNTSLLPNDPVFEYRFRIPPDEAPGLYWYHPHIHGYTNAQVQGGASGAVVVEGIEHAYPQLIGLPERVLVIRDQPLAHPDAQPLQSGNTPTPIVQRDREGDILNTGTGTGKPSRDLSINFVPVSYPEYKPAVISVKPMQRELWRVLNASAITYVDLQILIGNVPQPFGVVSLDGIPINENGMAANRVLWEDHVLLPPAGRMEFLFKGIPAGARATFITRSVDTGPAGENDPIRPLATILAAADAPDPPHRLADSPASQPPSTQTWLANVKPTRTRTLYFSEHSSNPADPNTPTVFMITVDGQPAKPYDPADPSPNIIAQQGEVEDWIIENRTTELHAFHIHQIHFLMLAWNGVPIDEPFLRDTVNVPYWDGKSVIYPSVKLRMDFRDPNTIGIFPYHCHLLEHEDGGMMGTIRVLPPPQFSGDR